MVIVWRLRGNIIKTAPYCLRVFECFCLLYYKRSWSTVKGQGHSVQTLSDRRIVALL